MSLYPTGIEFIADLMEVLGLPEETRSFTLKVEVDKPVIIECEYFVKDPHGETAIKKYKLTKEEIIE